MERRFFDALLPVVRAGGDIQPPVKLHSVLPEYPPLALQTGLEGLVIIECQVDTAGRVADARVLRGIRFSTRPPWPR